MEKRIFLRLVAGVVFFGVSFGVSAKECVILLHGLGSLNRHMVLMEYYFDKTDEYVSVNLSYDSRSDTIAQSADKVIPQSLAKCPKGETVNFVTHSMGGILVRSYLARNDIPNLGRVVMIAPPNQGSEAIDDPAYTYLQEYFGPAGLELSTKPDSTVNRLGPVNYDVGIIAGNATINPIVSDVIPGEDDGAVSVQRTWVEGANDWIVIGWPHSIITYSYNAWNLSYSYLKTGKFRASNEVSKLN